MERVGTLLEGMEGQDLLRTRLAEARALESWSDIVGTFLADRTRPLRLAGRRLFILCHGAALRQELTFHKRDILKKFNAAAGLRGAAREMVLLESDANLSSLVREAELEDERRRITEARERNLAAPRDPEEEPESSDARIAASYPKFDGAAYRRQLNEIAAERGAEDAPTAGPPRWKAPSGEPRS